MTAILRLARRYISRRVFQSVLFIIGVALGVAMVIAIDIANGSASRAFDLSAESVTGKATHQIVGGPTGLPSDLYTQVRLELGLRESAPVVEDYVRAAELGDRPLRLLGVDTFAEPPFRNYLSGVTVQGENPNTADAFNAFIAQPNTILISQTLANRYGIQPGDTITLRPGERRIPVRVIGVLIPGDSASQQALDNLLLTDIATAQEIVGQPGRITRIDLILPDDYDTRQIEAILPPGAKLTTPNAENSAINQMSDAFELNLQALSLLALVVGVFLIYNTVTFSVVQRRPLIGILRALGATRRQIFLLILGEAVLLGLIGTVLGLAVGIIFGRASVGLVAQTISDLYFTVNVQRVTVTPDTLLKGALIGLFASVAAAAIPSFEATRTPPAGTLRRSDVEQRAQRLVPAMTAAAVLLNGAGLLLLQIPTRDLTLSFTALFCIVVGGALLTPAVLVVLMRLSTPVADKLFGVIGRMAPRAIVRSLSRTSVAVAALTIAVSVIVGVTVMVGSFRNTVADWLDTTLNADIYISPPQVTATGSTADTDPALVPKTLTVPGVTGAATVRSISVTAPDYLDQPPANMDVVNQDISHGGRRFAWNHAPNGDTWVAMEAGQVIVSEPFAFRRGITPENDTIRLLTDKGVETFTVAGVFYDYSTDQGTILMADPVYRRFWDDPYITSFALFIAPDADLQQIINTLQTQTLAGYDLQVQSYRSLRTGVFAVFERAFSITTALQILATVVAFIGILSALMSLQLEQTRQYGVMRATGMTPRQLWRFTLIQTGLMGFTAGLLALPIGLALALVLIYVINVRSFGWTMQLQLQPGEFAQAFLVAVLAALAAGLYPAWRLGKLVTAQALRSE
ncbi:MAG: FtsX-like permease family protein [Chloroflexi bacterium]|nr:FtsX-like permease family protein [Chloroflexota bacterium]